MILAQLSDTHIVAAGKLFRCPMQGTAPNDARARREFGTAPYLARAVATLNVGAKARYRRRDRRSC